MYLWSLCLFLSPSTGLGEIRIWIQFFDPTSPKILRNNIAQNDWCILILRHCAYVFEDAFPSKKVRRVSMTNQNCCCHLYSFLTANVTVDTCLCMLMSHHKLLMSRLQQPLKNFEVFDKQIFFLFHASKWYVNLSEYFQKWILPTERA